MIINIISLYCSCKRHWRHWRHCWRHWSEAGNGLHRHGCNLPLPPFLNGTDKNIKKWLIFIKIKYIRLRGSVRLGSGLSPGRCNFSRFLESGFPWPNIFQLLYHNVVREDFTKQITWSPDLSVFTNAQHHLAVYIPMLGWVGVETLSKVSNTHSGFSCVTLTKKYDLVLN